MSKLHEDDFYLFEGIRAIVLSCIKQYALMNVKVEPWASVTQGGYVSYCAETRILSIMVRRQNKDIWHTNARPIEDIINDIGYFLHNLNKKTSKNKIIKHLLSSWRFVERNMALAVTEDDVI